MHTTPKQTLILRAFLQNRHSDWSWRFSIMSLVRLNFIRFAASGGVAWYLWHQGRIELAMLLVGILSGVVVRDLLWLRAMRRAWPVLRQVLDWDRVEDLVIGNAP
ncbi:MAG: hypothetical protein KF858_03470 [Candidatus Sumerlaeia bacterium]|nr:hypothetical protein [Candidatus Sumerlaeia bacterium]